MPKTFVPPSIADLRAYALEIGFRDFDAGQFLDHYEMVGWVIGRARTPMVSWRATVRTWQRNQAQWAGKTLKEQQDDPAMVDYAQQVRRCIDVDRGRDIGRLYAKIANAIGEKNLQRVKEMAQQRRE